MLHLGVLKGEWKLLFWNTEFSDTRSSSYFKPYKMVSVDSMRAALRVTSPILLCCPLMVVEFSLSGG